MAEQAIAVHVTTGVCDAKHKDMENQVLDCKEDIKRVDRSVGKLFDKLDSMNAKLWGLLATALASVIGSLVIQLIIKAK